MAYKVRFKPSAAKAFAKLDKTVQERIAPKLDALATTPHPLKTEKLAGEDAWRIRVGDHRIVYTIEDRVDDRSKPYYSTQKYPPSDPYT
jgi:mRNA interferase RelE/StbE